MTQDKARIKPATDPEECAEHWRSVALERTRELVVTRELVSLLHSAVRLSADGSLSTATAMELADRVVAEVMH